MQLRIFTEPQQGATYDDLLAVARATEELGFDAFFRSDHYLHMSGDGRPGPTDAWTTLAGLARDTSRIRLGTLVTSATFRLPGPLAVTVANVDQMSGGRVELGLGAGWFEAEHRAFGIPFPPVKERFDRLEAAYAALGSPNRFLELCRRLVAANPQDWRARLALARHRGQAGDPSGALELLFEALIHNPHGLMIHQDIWQTLSVLGRNQQLIDRYLAITRDAVFYLDPHVCVRCRYRSTELLWQCPQCHEWNTFIEERIAPAKDDQQLSA